MKRTQRTDGGGTIPEALGIFCTVLVLGQAAAAAVLFSTGQIDLDRCGRALAVLFPDTATPPAMMPPPATMPAPPTPPSLSEPAPPTLAREPADAPRR